MPLRFDCYYSLSSPWAYFAGPRLQDIARRHHATVTLKPYDFQKVVPVTGGVPLRTRPQPRHDYHAVELDRWRQYLGMPLNLKPRFYPPTDNIAPGHTVIAAEQAGEDAMLLSHAILRALWSEERDISDPDIRRAICNECGLNGDRLINAETTDAVTSAYKTYTDEAVTHGIFGAPTYRFNGTLFWGQDRLDFLDRALAVAAPAATG